MDIAIFTFTQNGALLGSRLVNFLQKENSVLIFGMEKFCNHSKLSPYLQPYQMTAADHVKECFCKDALIFIGAAGIAVRMIAPLVCHKTTDPCVLVLDELGKFVIPVLSGHIGGGNELALKIAGYLESTPAITTATDINHLFAVDSFAAKNQLTIDSLPLAKHISAALLAGQAVSICSDQKIRGILPDCLTLCSPKEIPKTAYSIRITANTKNPCTQTAFPDNTLRLIPKCIILGIGCRKGTCCQQIEDMVLSSLEDYALDIRSVFGVASIDLKEKETGLLQFCKKYRLSFTTYTAAELEQVSGSLSSSDFVKKVTGVSNICERSALAGNNKARLIMPKQAGNGVTAAAAIIHNEITF